MKRWWVLGLLILMALPLSASAQTDATIKIVKPGDRRNVELGQVKVTVEISGAALSDGYAWQMWIDNEPQGMVRDATETTITIPKPTGPHRLKVQLYDPNGNALASHEILVLAAPVEDHTLMFNQAWYAPAMAVMSLIILGLLILGLRLHPRTAA